MNAYWFNDPANGTTAGETVCNTPFPPGFGFRYSDERHWDNMGFEVLAASDVPAGDYSGLAQYVQPPAVRPLGGPSAPTNLRITGMLMLLFGPNQLTSRY